MATKKIQYQMPKGYLEGKARRRGAPILHSEVKEKLNLTLTPTVIKSITEEAAKHGVSRSELIERWVRSWETKEQV
jgi:hypothetical protein